MAASYVAAVMLARYWVVVVGVGVQSKAAGNSFNTVRLLAALQVAYVHAIYWLKLEPTWGYSWIIQFPGVPIFFAVSGYLVFDSLLRHATVKDFYRNRAVRIYPALLVNIVIIELLFAIGGGIRSMEPLRAAFFELVYVVTASDEIAAQWAGARAMRSFDGFFQIYPSGVLWTLTVELTFYASVPLFLFVRNWKAVASTIIVALGLASVALTGIHQPTLVALSVAPYFWMFGIGMLFRLWTPPPWAITSGAFVTFVAFILVAWMRDFGWLEWKANPQVTALLCLLALFFGSSPILKSRALVDYDISYGLYLYHMLIVTALMNAATSQWLLLAVLAGGMLAGLMSWHLIERPLMATTKLENTALIRRTAGVHRVID